jgi:hypothetical protein
MEVAKIQRIGTPIEPAGLGKVDVGVHQPGKNPGIVRKSDVLGTLGNNAIVSGPHTLDAITQYDDARAPYRRGAASIEQVAAVENDARWLPPNFGRD